MATNKSDKKTDKNSDNRSRDDKGHFKKNPDEASKNIGSTEGKKSNKDDCRVEIKIAPEKASAPKGKTQCQDGEPKIVGTIRISKTESSPLFGTRTSTAQYNIESDGTTHEIEPDGKGCEAPDKVDELSGIIKIISAENPPQIIVGGRPYYSKEYVENLNEKVADYCIGKMKAIVAGAAEFSGYAKAIQSIMNAQQNEGGTKEYGKDTKTSTSDMPKYAEKRAEGPASKEAKKQAFAEKLSKVVAKCIMGIVALGFVSGVAFGLAMLAKTVIGLFD